MAPVTRETASIIGSRWPIGPSGAGGVWTSVIEMQNVWRERFGQFVAVGRIGEIEARGLSAGLHDGRHRRHFAAVHPRDAERGYLLAAHLEIEDVALDVVLAQAPG